MKRPDELIERLKQHQRLRVYMMPEIEPLLKYIDHLESKDNSVLHSIKESYLPISWINGNPCIDGATAYPTMNKALEYVDSLPKIKGHEHTICKIRNSP